MMTMIESCVSLLHDERFSEALKFGLPVIVVSDVQLEKQFTRFVAFCPKPDGRCKDSNELQFWKQPIRLL